MYMLGRVYSGMLHILSAIGNCWIYLILIIASKMAYSNLYIFPKMAPSRMQPRGAERKGIDALRTVLLDITHTEAFNTLLYENKSIFVAQHC